MIDMQSAEATAAGVWPDDDNELTTTREHIEKRIGIHLGYGPHRKAWTNAQIQEIKEIFKEGMRLLCNPPVIPGMKYPHQWGWLKPLATITTAANDGATICRMTSPTWMDHSRWHRAITCSIRRFKLSVNIKSASDRQGLQSTGRPMQAAIASKLPRLPMTRRPTSFFCGPSLTASTSCNTAIESILKSSQFRNVTRSSATTHRAVLMARSRAMQPALTFSTLRHSPAPGIFGSRLTMRSCLSPACQRTR